MRRPLAVLVVLGGALAGIAAHAADLVVVRLVDDRFEPAELTFEHGKAYRLQLENLGKEMHEFKAETFFHAATIHDATAMTPDRSELVLQPGQTKQVEFTAPAAGSYELTCPDHDWYGMVGKIDVR